MSKKLKSLLSLGNNIYLLAIISHLLITFVCYINIFPSGYIFSGADVVQFFNLDKVIHDFKYVWWNTPGEGVFLQYYSYIIFYYLVYFLSFLLNLSISGQSFAYFFIFLNGSFISFLLGLYFFKKEYYLSNISKIILSLIYTFNIYTLYNFYYTWGYSPFLFLYILLPLIFPLTFRFFSSATPKEKLKTSTFLVFILFLTNIPNGNLSFFISLNIFLFIFIFWLYFYFGDKFWTFFKKTVLYYLIYFSSVCWSVLPQLVEMLRLSSIVNSGDYPFDFTYWVIWQATKFNDLFHVIRIDFERSFTLFNFGILLFIFLFVFLGLTIKTGVKIKKIFLLMLFISLFLLNKGVGLFPAETVNALFSNPLLITLKSYDKVLVFVPYLILMIIAVSFNSSLTLHRYLLGVLLLISLVTCYPLLLGKIQTNYSLVFDYNTVDYTSAEYSYLHKIPDSYISASSLLNAKNPEYKILHVPYSVINSVGWVNYPKWKVVGADPLPQLFNNPSIHLNSFGSFGSWNYGKFWNDQQVEDSYWILPFSGMLGAKYYIYHKDISPRFYDNTYNKIVAFEREGFLKEILNNDYFNLYELSDTFMYPSIYIPNKIVTLSDLDINLPKFLNNNFNNSTKLAILGSTNLQAPENVKHNLNVSYKKISPVKYMVSIKDIDNLTYKIPLVFNESYHPGWTINYSNNINVTLESILNTSFFDHSKVNHYANFWNLDPSYICISNNNCITNSDGTTEINLYIEFWPQYLYNFSLSISLLSLFMPLFVYLFYSITYVKK